MSRLSDALDTIETITGARWIRIALKLLPYIVIVGLAIGLIITRATLHDVRQADKLAIAEQRRREAEQLAANAQRLAAAADTYAQRTAALKTIILTSREMVERYAETPAGRAPCLGADRVRGIDDLDASLRAANAAQGSAEAVPADAGAAPAGR